MWLYLDNSIINNIVDDPNCDLILDRLKRQFVTRISIVNLVEASATPDEDKRGKLVGILRILSSARPLADPATILDRHLTAFLHRKRNIDVWLDRKHPALRILQSGATPVRSVQKYASEAQSKFEADWQEMHNLIRSRIQPKIDNNPKVKSEDPNRVEVRLGAFLRNFRDNSTLILETMRVVLKASNKNKELAGKELAIFKSSDVWPFIFTAWGIVLFNRSFLPQNYSAKKNPGFTDTNQAVYLAWTDVFATNDFSQKRMLRLVARTGKKPRHVLSYALLLRKLGF